MSCRIYNLVKELKSETNEVLEVCRILGVKGTKKNADSENILRAISLVSDEDADRIRKYFSDKKLRTIDESLEAKRAAAAPEPPKRSSTRKIRRIQPARGRITEVDPNKRTISPVKEAPPAAAKPATTTKAAAEKPATKTTPKKETEKAAAADAPKVSEAEKKAVKAEADATTAAAPSATSPAKASPPAKDVETVDAAKTTVESKVETPATRAESPATKKETKAAAATKTTEPAAGASVSQPAETTHPAEATKKSPLRRALERGRGEGQRRSRAREDKDKDKGRGSRTTRRSRRQQPDTHSTRPAPVASSFIAQLESKAQVLDEMKRPPKITTHEDDRIRVIGGMPKPKSDSDSSSSQSSSKRTSPKPQLNHIHFAPMPTETSRPAAKTDKEPAAQKPEKRLPIEILRGSGRAPLADKLRSLKSGGSSSRSGRSSRRSSQDGFARGTMDRFQTDSGPADYDQSSYGRGKGRRERKEHVGGRSDSRGSRRRRNEARRYRNEYEESVGFRYAQRPGGRTGRRSKRSSSGSSTVPRKTDVVIETPCSARQFAESTGLPVPVVIKKLLELGYLVNPNQSLDKESLELLIVEFELKATLKEDVSLEEQYVEPAYDVEDPPESLVPRAPVVTFLGHVDHGKTSLLDRILNLHVAQGEKGGITQRISAYRVDTPGGPVTFVDTPGHEAFTAMRARGANVTDIAVLVVAADDGVMPQTEEAISHARAAEVPIIVALNKMDLPGANRDRVIQQLANNDLMPSEWGGDVEIVETSALTGDGVEDLLEMLLTVAELHELKANPERLATGVVLESTLRSGEGAVCTALVQKGTLETGDVVLCGPSYGRVRSMTDTLDSSKRMNSAGPSVPVSITGLDVAPEAGSRFVVLEDVAIARQIAEERADRAHEIELAGAPSHVTLENLLNHLSAAKTQQVLNLIVRADVRGSIEAIRKELGKFDHPEVKVKILQASVGGVTEADVHLADASDALIVAFNVVPDEKARALAETKGIQIRRYDIIYKLTDDIHDALEGMLKPIEQIKELGRALVQRAFNISRVGVVAGCRVLYGTIERDCQIRVIRDSRIIGEYKLDTLRREKDDAKEVHEGYECGIKLKNFNDVKEGDVLEAYKIEEIAQSFD